MKRRPKHYSVVARLDDGTLIGYCHHGVGQHSHFFAAWCRTWRNRYDLEPTMPSMRWRVENERKP